MCEGRGREERERVERGRGREKKKKRERDNVDQSPIHYCRLRRLFLIGKRIKSRKKKI